METMNNKILSVNTSEIKKTLNGMCWKNVGGAD